MMTLYRQRLRHIQTSTYSDKNLNHREVTGQTLTKLICFGMRSHTVKALRKIGPTSCGFAHYLFRLFGDGDTKQISTSKLPMRLDVSRMSDESILIRK